MGGARNPASRLPQQSSVRRRAVESCGFFCPSRLISALFSFLGRPKSHPTAPCGGFVHVCGVLHCGKDRSGSGLGRSIALQLAARLDSHRTRRLRGGARAWNCDATSWACGTRLASARGATSLSAARRRHRERKQRLAGLMLVAQVPKRGIPRFVQSRCRLGRCLRSQQKPARGKATMSAARNERAATKLWPPPNPRPLQLGWHLAIRPWATGGGAWANCWEDPPCAVAVCPFVLFLVDQRGASSREPQEGQGSAAHRVVGCFRCTATMPTTSCCSGERTQPAASLAAGQSLLSSARRPQG